MLENKSQLIHIASEAVVFAGIIVYFSQKNRRLMTYIEELAKRIEEQDDILQKHALQLEYLTKSVEGSSGRSRQSVKQKVPTSVAATLFKIVSPPPERMPPPHQQSAAIQEIVDEDEDGSNLDEEISDELKELDSIEEND